MSLTSYIEGGPNERLQRIFGGLAAQGADGSFITAYSLEQERAKNTKEEEKRNAIANATFMQQLEALQREAAELSNALGDIQDNINSWIATLSPDDQALIRDIETFRTEYVGVEALGKVRIAYKDSEDSENPDKYYVFDDDGKKVFFKDFKDPYKDQAQKDLQTQLADGQKLGNADTDEAQRLTEQSNKFLSEKNDTLRQEYNQRTNGEKGQAFDIFSKLQDNKQQQEALQKQIQNQINESPAAQTPTKQIDTLTLEVPSPEEMAREAELANAARNYADAIRLNGGATRDDVEIALEMGKLSPAEWAKVEQIFAEQEIELVDAPQTTPEEPAPTPSVHTAPQPAAAPAAPGPGIPSMG